ncbi:MAG: recombination-associated protein RdgC [Tahibacter sp.]
MWFRNLSLFRFSESVAESLQELEGDLDKQRLRPCGPMELSTRGFVSPHGRNEEMLVHRQGNYALVTLGGEDKLLPSSVVNEELAARLQKITEKEDRRIGARERKRVKDEVLTDLMPRAFVRPYRLNAYIDAKNGWLVVDTSSRKSAEEALSQLREAAGSFPATPMAPEESPRSLMTDWVVHGKLPAGLTLGDECELRDPAESGAIVRCRRQDLETDEVREHLKTGKQVFQLGLTFDDRISLVLGEDLVVRKLRFLDQVLDGMGETQNESAAAELDSRMALMTLEVERLLAKMEEWFGLPRPKDR